VYNVDIRKQWPIDERPRFGEGGKALPLIATPHPSQSRSPLWHHFAGVA
jgi:hypothetical protein